MPQRHLPHIIHRQMPLKALHTGHFAAFTSDLFTQNSCGFPHGLGLNSCQGICKELDRHCLVGYGSRTRTSPMYRFSPELLIPKERHNNGRSSVSETTRSGACTAVMHHG